MSPDPRYLCAGALIAGALFFSIPVEAAVFRLGRWSGQVQTGIDFSRTVTTSNGSRTSTTDDLLTQEQVSLQNRGGYIVSPKLLTLDFGGSFGLFQENFQQDIGGVSGDQYRDGNVWGYNASMGILPGQDISLRLLADRNQTFQDRASAGTSEITWEREAARVTLRRLRIPSVVTFQRTLRDDETRSGSSVSLTDEEDRTVTYEGRRGWVNSELRVDYEFIDHIDKIDSSRDYLGNTGDLMYSLDFGPDLNWRLNSGLQVNSRVGGGRDFTTVNTSQTLSVEHTERLSTRYGYFFNYTNAAGGGISSTHTGRASLSHRLYENLTTTSEVLGRFQRQENGKQNIYTGSLNFAYMKPLAAEARLNVDLGAAYTYDESRFEEPISFVSQEIHVASTPFALPIDLNNPFVVESSVVVTKVAVGPLPVGCIPPPGPPTPLVLGQDYTLQTTTGNITQIVPIACAGAQPGINPGDTIAVDYQFAVPQDLTTGTVNWHAGVSTSYRWITAFYAHREQKQTLIKGTPGDEQFIDNKHSDTLGTRLSYAWPRLRASFSATGRSVSGDREVKKDILLTQNVGYSILPWLTTALDGSETWIDSIKPDLQSTVLSGSLSLSVFPPGTHWSARAFVSARHKTESDQENQLITDAGLEAGWRLRQLEVRSKLLFHNDQQGGAGTSDYIFSLKIIRHF